VTADAKKNSGHASKKIFGHASKKNFGHASKKNSGRATGKNAPYNLQQQIDQVFIRTRVH
jgi:hypothetical protein